MFHDVLSLETERSHVCSCAVLGMGVTPQDSLPAHAPETIIKTAFRRRQERQLTESALTEHRKQAPHALANVKSENQVRDPAWQVGSYFTAPPKQFKNNPGERTRHACSSLGDPSRIEPIIFKKKNHDYCFN